LVGFFGSNIFVNNFLKFLQGFDLSFITDYVETKSISKLNVAEIILTQIKKELIVSNLLGDAYLGFQKKNGKFIGNSRLEFGFKDKKYSEFIFENYKSLCTNNRKLNSYIHLITGLTSDKFSTRSLPALTILHFE
jgi:hypothetical protein